MPIYTPYGVYDNEISMNAGLAKAESSFQQGVRETEWFKEFVSDHGEEPDLDTQDYDYRAAWNAGVRPDTRDPTDGKFHWSSAFKGANHPNRYVDGVDTITNTAVVDHSGLNATQRVFLGALNLAEKAGIGGAPVRVFNDIVSRGRRDPITEKDFSKAELVRLRDLLQSTGKDEGSIDYGDYQKHRTSKPVFEQDLDLFGEWRNTLGGFKYKKDAEGNYSVEDVYDFSPKTQTSDGPNNLFTDLGAFLAPYHGAAKIGRQVVPDGKGIPVNINLKGIDDLPDDDRKSGKLDLGTDILFPKDPERSAKFIEALGKTWPVEAAKSIYNAVGNFVDIAHRASKGEMIDTDEATKAATALGWEAMQGGLATAGLRPGVGMFGGVYTKASRDLAEQMELQGYKTNTIKEVTGLERGKDFLWRNEISDKEAKISERIGELNAIKNTKEGWKRKTMFLNEVFDHPELFKAYPELSLIKVKLDPSLKGIAQFSNDEGLISLKPEALTEPSSKLKNIFLHEVQHAIQRIEGFAMGGNYQSQGGRLPYDLLKGSIEEFKKIDAKRASGQKLEDHEEHRLMIIARAINQDMDRAGYRALAGEVEARNTEKRANWSDRDRARIGAVFTEDIPREEQNVMMPTVESMEQYLKEVMKR